MGVRNGKQFLEGLRDGREIWLEGERVADVTTHPKLARMAQTLAGLYDLQESPDYHEQMTFRSPSSGDLVSLSFLVPETYEDLIRRRKALEVTAGACYGMLGRTPDYVNIQLTAMRQMSHVYGSNDPVFQQRLLAYHEYVRESDLCLTHTFGHPQVNRAVPISDLPDPYVALGVVDTSSEGVIVRGGKAPGHPRALLRRDIRPGGPAPAPRGGRGQEILYLLLHSRQLSGAEVHLPPVP
jgi:aromatic ring hydroxylase